VAQGMGRNPAGQLCQPHRWPWRAKHKGVAKGCDRTPFATGGRILILSLRLNGPHGGTSLKPSAFTKQQPGTCL
jgi:hypothetical protein